MSQSRTDAGPGAFFAEHFAASPFMVILRGHDPAGTVRLCERAAAAGIRLIEVPVQDAAAFPALRAALDWGAGRGALVGAGTVTSVDTARRVQRMGAAFTVAPGIFADVSAACRDLGLPHLPGVQTATEIGLALRLGHGWQKAFPASLLGPAWLTAMHGPYPDVRFVVTGGIDTGNAAAFLAAGAAAASLGSSFARSEPAAIRALAADRPA
jgi:2-dehydro-3-deoxyphosphogluconate aldolase / (4S)-4-hydroxy-2-oxoglutarate aldolase